MPEREYASGLSEVVKYGAIRSPEFFAWLEANVEPLRGRDADRQCKIVVFVPDKDLAKVSDAMFIAGRVDSPAELEEAIWQREDVYSTGFGHGFAVPHCKSQAVKA